MLWFTLLSLSLLFILTNGIDYVSWPRLLPPTDIIYYSGPGFRSAHNGKGFIKAGAAEAGIGKAGRWLSKGARIRTAGNRIAVEEVELGNPGKKRVD